MQVSDNDNVKDCQIVSASFSFSLHFSPQKPYPIIWAVSHHYFFTLLNILRCKRTEMQPIRYWAMYGIFGAMILIIFYGVVLNMVELVR